MIIKILVGNIPIHMDRFSQHEPNKQLKIFDELLDRGEKTFWTNSPYILNYLNLLILKYDKGFKGLDFNRLEVWYINENNEYISLKILNEKLINTNCLSDTINNIYNEYYELKNK